MKKKMRDAEHKGCVAIAEGGGTYLTSASLSGSSHQLGTGKELLRRRRSKRRQCYFAGAGRLFLAVRKSANLNLPRFSVGRSCVDV